MSAPAVQLFYLNREDAKGAKKWYDPVSVRRGGQSFFILHADLADFADVTDELDGRTMSAPAAQLFD